MQRATARLLRGLARPALSRRGTLIAPPPSSIFVPFTARCYARQKKPPPPPPQPDPITGVCTRFLLILYTILSYMPLAFKPFLVLLLAPSQHPGLYLSRSINYFLAFCVVLATPPSPITFLTFLTVLAQFSQGYHSTQRPYRFVRVGTFPRLDPNRD